MSIQATTRATALPPVAQAPAAAEASAAAARSAAAGAAGVETSGSIGALARRDIRDNRNDITTMNANTAARQRARAVDGQRRARGDGGRQRLHVAEAGTAGAAAGAEPGTWVQ